MLSGCRVYPVVANHNNR